MLERVGRSRLFIYFLAYVECIVSFPKYMKKAPVQKKSSSVSKFLIFDPVQTLVVF